MLGFFKKFKEGLKKTSESVWGVLFGKPLAAESLEELEEALYAADFGPSTIKEIIALSKAFYKKNKALQNSAIADIGRKVVAEVLQGSEPPMEWLKEDGPQVIVLLGVNGSGKTTTAAKLAYQFKQKNKKVLLGACDTFRAAANEQIQIWSQCLDIPLVASQHGADAASVAYDAFNAARGRKMDALILDTAGRLHNKSNLMEELAKINRVLQKLEPSAPHHKWLVLDGTSGSNLLEQARMFHETMGLTGLIITKLDGTCRGGAIVSIYRELRLPIYFVGLGEKPEDLLPFSIDYYTQAIFGNDQT